MNYTIDKNNIFLAKCVVFERRENDYLVKKTLDENDEYRVFLFFNGKLIDFITAEDLPLLPYDDSRRIIDGEILENTYYVEEVYNYKQLTNKELEYVPTLLSRYQEKKLAEKSKKLLKFPRKRLN